VAQVGESEIESAPSYLHHISVSRAGIRALSTRFPWVNLRRPTIATVPGVCHVNECVELRSRFHPPWVGIFPAKALKSVDFPAPEGPMMAVT
jgi:hypothetical protein